MADQWEYTRVYVDFQKDDLGHSHADEGWAKVDQLGLDGWEAVGIAPHVGSTHLRMSSQSFTVTHGLYILLKRRKP